MEPLATKPGSKVQRLSVKEGNGIALCRMCPERPYIMLYVPSNARVVDEVKFTITSHDQGVLDCSEP
jgi:hypothetical protein